MKTIEFLTTPLLDEQQVNVKGFGYLPLMHSSDIKVFDGKLYIMASHNMFDSQAYGYGPGRSAVSKSAKWVQQFNDLDFVVVQRDYADDDRRRDGYIGVFQMGQKDISESVYSCDLIARVRDGTPSEKK